MFTNLLVPLDGSQLAESVLPIVRKLSELMSCSVMLLHVIEKRPPSSIHGDTHLQDVAGAERYMAAIAEQVGDWGLPVSSHVHTVPQGDIPRCIAEHAEELDQDLIVLCTHGSSGVRRFVFGSNAEQVLTHGRTPVVLVKADERGRPPSFGPAKILALRDTTPESVPVLTACSELAKISDAQLHLLYVVPTAGTVSNRDAPGMRLVPHTARLLLDLEAEETARLLKAEVQDLLSNAIDCSGSVERGEAVAAVVGAAREKNADIVAMATRGLAGLGALWAYDLVSGISTAYDGVLLLFPTRRD
ncbi:MAG: universal stress protein [Syntrophobacter sp.]